MADLEKKADEQAEKLRECNKLAGLSQLDINNTLWVQETINELVSSLSNISNNNGMCLLIDTLIMYPRVSRTPTQAQQLHLYSYYKRALKIIAAQLETAYPIIFKE